MADAGEMFIYQYEIEKQKGNWYTVIIQNKSGG